MINLIINLKDIGTSILNSQYFFKHFEKFDFINSLAAD